MGKKVLNAQRKQTIEYQISLIFCEENIGGYCFDPPYRAMAPPKY